MTKFSEDNVSGKIDDAWFAKIAKRYEQQQGKNALETVRRYTDITTITKRMVGKLIDYIEVYTAVKEDGVITF